MFLRSEPDICTFNVTTRSPDGDNDVDISECKVKRGYDASFTCDLAWGALRPSGTLAAHQSPLWMGSSGGIEHP